MQLADSPRKIALAFAANGEKNTIPEDSSPTPGAASMNDGFPPETRQPEGSGGIPPNGLDMNGVLYYLSLLNRWQSAGAGFVYDSVFANNTDVNGYPKGAVLLRADGEGFWISKTDANTNNPDINGTNWHPFNNFGITFLSASSSDLLVSASQGARDIIIINGTLTANINLIVPTFVKSWIVTNNTTGAFTVTVKTASGTGGLITQNTSRVFYGDGTNVYGVNPLAASQAQVNTGTDTLTFLTPQTFNNAQKFSDINSALNNKAELNGSSSQAFEVATATTSTQAITKDQFDAKTSLATESTAGILEIGTQAEANALLLDDKAITPLKLGNGFAASFGANGYIKLPNWMGGLMVQWGKTTQSVANDTVIFAAGGFSASCYAVVASPETSGNVVTHSVNSVTSSSFKFSADYWNGSTFVSAPWVFFWIAIGK